MRPIAPTACALVALFGVFACSSSDSDSSRPRDASVEQASGGTGGDAGPGGTGGAGGTAGMGASGGSAGSGGLEAGPVETLLDTKAYISRFIVGGTTMYWVQSDGTGKNHSLHARAVAGGAAEMLDSAEISALAFAEGYLYFARSDGTLLRRGEQGGAIETLASGQGSILDVTADTQFAYFAASTPGDAGGLVSNVLKVPVTGGAPTAVATGGGPLAVDATHIYWLGDGVWRAALPSGGAEEWIGTQVGPSPVHDLIVDATHLYFATGNDPGTVGSVAKSDKTVTDFEDMVLFANALVADAAHLYFAHEGTWAQPPLQEHGVARVPLGGGAFEIVESVPLGDYVYGTGLAGNHVYWATYSGKIQRKLK